MVDDARTNGTEPPRADEQTDADGRTTLADASHTPPNDADSATGVWARGDESLGPADD